MTDEGRAVHADYHGAEAAAHDGCELSMSRFHPIEHDVATLVGRCEAPCYLDTTFGSAQRPVLYRIGRQLVKDHRKAFGCAGGQGYFFGKPADADATLGYLRDSYRGALYAKAI